jgi:4-amino-4-deoxy-L-arabinose transferase-like glycosyltransferase
MSTIVRTKPLGSAARRAMPEEAVPLSLLLITLLALLLRVFRINASSLWIDELITIWQGTVLGDSLWRQFLDDVQSPLPMVVTAWLSKASVTEAWLRLPGALLGAATPALLYAAGRHVVGRRAALLAALLLAVHPLHVFHSQEVRGYAYLLFFGLAAASLALGVRGSPSWRRVALIASMGTAAVLSNLQGLFWMGGLALGLVVAGRVRRQDLGRWGAAFGLILLLTVPWWSSSLGVHASERLLPGEPTGEALRGETTFSPWSLPYTGFVLSVGSTVGPSTRELNENIQSAETRQPRLPREHIPIVVTVALLTLGLAVRGFRALGWRSRELLLWAAVPLVLALALALRNVKPFNPRYVLSALPSLLLVLGAGLDSLPRRPGFLILLVWLGLDGVGLYRHYFDADYMHEDVRGAARLIEAREGSDDVILAPTVYRVFEHYYRGENPLTNIQGQALAGPDQVGARLQSLEPSRRYLWYVRSRPWHGDPKGLLLAGLESKYQTSAVFELPGVEVRLYDREPPSGEEELPGENQDDGGPD